MRPRTDLIAGALALLLALSLGATAHASFRSANGRIAFQANAPEDFTSHIYLMNKDGTGRTNITLGGGGFAHYDPACSPDGTRVAFIEVNSSNGAVITVDSNGANRQYPYTGHHAASAPAWSPDGTRLVWALFGSNGNQLVVANADGSNPVAITGNNIDPNTGQNLDGWNYQPDWSADGKKIAFSSTRDGDNDIYTINLNTGVVKQLTNTPGFDSEPSWAPGGSSQKPLGVGQTPSWCGAAP